MNSKQYFDSLVQKIQVHLKSYDWQVVAMDDDTIQEEDLNYFICFFMSGKSVLKNTSERGKFLFNLFKAIEKKPPQRVRFEFWEDTAKGPIRHGGSVVSPDDI